MQGEDVGLAVLPIEVISIISANHRSTGGEEEGFDGEEGRKAARSGNGEGDGESTFVAVADNTL